MRRLSTLHTLPWVCIGDFNDILHQWEKVGKRPVQSYRLHSFRELLHDCALMDLETKSCAYTWVNNRNGEEVVKERLDRALCTIEWRLKYSEAEVLALPAIGSDHSPILLTTNVAPVKRRKSFTFESFWLQDAKCREVISKSWYAWSSNNALIS